MTGEPQNLDMHCVSWGDSVWFALRIVIHVALGGRLHIARFERSCMVLFGLRIGG